MRCYFAFLQFVLLFSSCSSASHEPQAGVEEIVIDPEKVEPYLNLSEILDDSIEIIPLETNDECLISTIKRLEFYRDRIYVADEVSGNLLEFTSTGRYQRTVGRKGNGPGEYIRLDDFAFKGDSVIVLDGRVKKYVIYDLYSDLFREVPYDTWHLESLSFGNNVIYQILNHSKTGYGHSNLLKFDLGSGKVLSSALSFDARDEYKSGYGLMRCASRFDDDTAMLILPLSDTIYTVKEDTIYTSYLIRFTSRNLPADLDVKQDDIFRYVHRNNYLKGLGYLQASTNFLLGYYADKGWFRYILYDKRTSDCKVGEWFYLCDWGNLMVFRFCTLGNDGFCFYQEAETLLTNWKTAREKCTNVYKEKIDKLVASLTEDSNPVLFKTRFKE